jgi:hypothetical protein
VNSKRLTDSKFMQPLQIEFGVADAPGAHRPTDRGMRIKGIKAQLRVGNPAAEERTQLHLPK